MLKQQLLGDLKEVVQKIDNLEITSKNTALSLELEYKNKDRILGALAVLEEVERTAPEKKTETKSAQ